jgi:signal transduction histidine kinase/ABC-type branched-subunit amino acid transport system ATPase component
LNPPLIRILDLSIVETQHTHLDKLNLCVFSGQDTLLMGYPEESLRHLSQVLMGFEKPLSGLIEMEGNRYHVSLRSLQNFANIASLDSNCYGIKDLHVFEQISLEANHGHFFWNHLFFLKHRQKAIALCRELLAPYPPSIDPEVQMRQLDLSERLFLMLFLTLHFKKPKLLVLYDFFNWLSPQRRAQAENLIKSCQQQNNLSVLRLGNNLDQLDQKPDRVIVIKSGKTLLDEAFEHIDQLSLIRICMSEMSGFENQYLTAELFQQNLKGNRTLLKDLPQPILVVNPDRELLICNHSAKHLFGLKESSSLTHIDSVLESFCPELHQFFLHLGEGLQTLTFDITSQQLGNDGETKTIKACAQKIWDGDKFQGKLLMLEDISALEKLRQKASSQEALAATGLLAAGVAHEINNPLQICMGLLNSQSMQNELPKALSDQLQQEFEQMKLIVSQLSAIHAKKSEQRSIFCCHEMIHNLLSLLRPTVKERHIELEFDATGKLELESNATECRQILLNLIKNAIDAIRDHGRIDIETYAFEKGEDAMLTIAVIDDGPGLKAEPQQLFQPFFSTKGHQHHNMGLGLSIVKNLTENNGGEVSCRNNKNKGCRFEITFPRSSRA